MTEEQRGTVRLVLEPHFTFPRCGACTNTWAKMPAFGCWLDRTTRCCWDRTPLDMSGGHLYFFCETESAPDLQERKVVSSLEVGGTCLGQIMFGYSTGKSPLMSLTTKLDLTFRFQSCKTSLLLCAKSCPRTNCQHTHCKIPLKLALRIRGASQFLIGDT